MPPPSAPLPPRDEDEDIEDMPRLNDEDFDDDDEDGGEQARVASDGIDENGDNATDEDEAEFESTWVAPTILRVHSIVDDATLSSMNKYFVKHQRVWKDSVVVDEVSDGEDSDEEDSTDDAEPASNGARRGCFIASDTNTLMKFYNSIDPIVQASVEQFIERFRHFDMISTFDDYTTVEYRDGSFRREAPEKLSLEHGDAALCTLVAIVLLTDTDGKDLCFPLQTDADGQPMYLEANAGDVFVWPACALHPYEVMNRDTRKVFRYVQVNIT